MSKREHLIYLADDVADVVVEPGPGPGNQTIYLGNAGEIVDTILDALMEPNEAMVKAAHKMDAKWTGRGEIRTRAVFRAMIQAAKESGE